MNDQDTWSEEQADSSAKLRAIPAWDVMLWLVLSLVPVTCGVGLGVSESYILDVTTIAADAGAGYTAPVPPAALAPWLVDLGDDPEHPRRSSSLLTEDGKGLGPPHSQHTDIRNGGAGAFSRWGEYIMFSASDGSDPRSNGRVYRLWRVALQPFAVAIAWAVWLALGAWLATLRGGAWARANPPTVMVVTAAAVIVPTYAVVLTSSLGERLPLSVATEQAAWVGATLLSWLLAFHSGRRIAASALPTWRLHQVYAPVVRLARAVEAASTVFDGAGRRARASRAASVGVALALFVAVLVIRWPVSTLRSAHEETLPALLWAGLPLVLCFWRRDWLGTGVGLAITLVLFAFPLAAMWQDVGIHGSAIGGLLPFSDASGYWVEAQRLLDGEPLNWGARRPGFAGLLATLLAVTNRDLAWSLAILVALNAFSTYLLARESRLSFGPFAGALTVLLCWSFYIREGGLGTTLTENLGLAVGALGFAALLRGARESRPVEYAAGLGLVTFALMARAGAFFVLPALGAAALWEFRRHDLRRIAAVGAGAMVLAAGLSLINGRLLSNPQGPQQAFSNYSYSLYGLVVGGKGWGQADLDHPGVKEGGEVYALAWHEFRRRPSGLVEGMSKMWGVYFDRLSPFHAYAFVRDSNQMLLLHRLCYIFAAVGLVVSLIRFRQPFRVTLLMGSLGHLASIPFVPPIDAGLRVYAATMALPMLLVAVGVSVPLMWAAALVRRLRRSHGAGVPVAPSVAWPRAALHVGLATSAAVLVCPQILLRVGGLPQPPTVQCQGSEVMLQVRLSPGTFLDVTDGNGPSMISATAIRQGDLRQTLGVIELQKDAGRVTAGNVLAASYNVITGRPVWLLTARQAFPSKPGVYAVCATPSADEQARSYGLHYAGSAWRSGPGTAGR